MPLHTDHKIESPNSGIWLYIKSGHMINRDTGEEIAGVSGAFDGFRIAKKKKFDGYQLVIRLLDEEGTTYLVAGDLDAFGNIQTWARMVLGRLGHPERPVRQGDRIRLEILPWAGPKGVASLCRISLEDDLTDLEEARIENRDDLRSALERVIEAAPWSGGEGYLPSASDLPALGEGKVEDAVVEKTESADDDDDLPF